jgi:predicted RNase H-like HicB family nuclease
VIGWLLWGIGIEPAAEMPGATKRDGGKIASGKTARRRTRVAGRGGCGLRLSLKEHYPKSRLADCCRHINLAPMKTVAKFNARVLRDGKWFVAFSPEFPESNGQGLTEAEALQSLRESILLLLEDRLEDAQASLGCGEKLVPLALT